MENIRVLVKTSDLEATFHESSGNEKAGCDLSAIIRPIAKPRQITVVPRRKHSDRKRQRAFAGGRARPLVAYTRCLTRAYQPSEDVKPSQEVPSYRGSLELEKAGWIVVINEVLLEGSIFTRMVPR